MNTKQIMFSGHSPNRRRFSATGHDIHIDKTLSQIAINYKPEGFIADLIMPMVTVDKQSDHYAVFSRADKLRRQNTIRAQGTRAQRVDQNVSSGTFYAENYALYSPVTIEERANADPIYLQEIINGRTELIMDHLLLDMEVRVASQVNSTSNVGNNAAVGSSWLDVDNSDPLGDVNSIMDTVQDACTMKPNLVVFGLDAWKAFKRHPDVRNLIYGTNNGGGYANQTQVGQLLEVENVVVGGAYQNTADENLTESLSKIWTNNVLVAYKSPRPNRDRPSFAYSFRWQGAGLPNMQAERHPYDSHTKSEDVEVGYYQDEVITGSEYAGLLTSVTSV